MGDLHAKPQVMVLDLDRFLKKMESTDQIVAEAQLVADQMESGHVREILDLRALVDKIMARTKKGS